PAGGPDHQFRPDLNQPAHHHPRPDLEPLDVACHVAARDVTQPLPGENRTREQDDRADDREPAPHTPPYTTDFSSVYCRNASTPCSLPNPDCLVPPKGSSSWAMTIEFTDV